MTKEIKNLDIILPTAFLGSVWTYALYFKGTIRIEGQENYQKRTTRNKCFIKTAQGKKSISIPLKSGKNQQQLIKKVRISYEENWIKEFKHGLTTNYSGSPYIAYYLPEIMSIINKEPNHLWELNWELNQLILHFLSIYQKPLETTEWKDIYQENTLDLRKSKNLWDLQYQYPQLFEEKDVPFLEDLSILDLLFCCGPEARIHLINIAEQMIVKANMN